MMFTATLLKHPSFIRYPRGSAEGVPIKEVPGVLEIGKAEVIRGYRNNGGRKIALFGLGNMLRLAREAAVELEKDGCDVAIINPRFFKPLDSATHQFFAGAAEVVATLEDHVAMGGYGSAVLELMSEHGITTPTVRIAWPDVFIEHASTVDYLRQRHGLTVENLLTQVRAKLSARSGSGVSSPSGVRIA